MAPQASEPREKILNAAATLFAENGWSRVSLNELRESSGVEPRIFDAHFDSKLAVVEGLVRKFTAESVAGAMLDPDDSIRDRLFELLMMRFDAALAYKPAIRALSRAAPFDPELALTLGFALARAMARTLEAAGVPIRGPIGLLRIEAMTAIQAGATRKWLDDDSPDMAATMAFLDRQLGFAERLAGRLARPGPFRPRGDGEEADRASEDREPPASAKAARGAGARSGKARRPRSKPKPSAKAAKKGAGGKSRSKKGAGKSTARKSQKKSTAKKTGDKKRG